MSGCFGRGSAIGHAGELLQGVLDGEPFLVTLPAPVFRSLATVRLVPVTTVAPAGKTKALAAALLAFVELGGVGAFELSVDTRMPIGRGCGSSTADCVAAVRAVADLLGAAVSPEQTAAWVCQAEQACDSTMFAPDVPLAFRPRTGRVLRRLGPAWPALEVTVVDLGGPDIDTLGQTAIDYSANEVAEFSDLLREVEFGEPISLARAALRSAQIHQRHRPHPNWEALVRAACEAGAYGVARSHSGAVAAVLGPLVRPLPHLASYNLRGLTDGDSTSRGW